MEDSRFEITFKDGKVIEAFGFNAEQAGILASAERIKNGESASGLEHRIEKMRVLRPYAGASDDNVEVLSHLPGGAASTVG